MAVQQLFKPHSRALASHRDHHRTVPATALGGDDLHHLGDNALPGASGAGQDQPGTPARVIALTLIR